MEKRRLLAKSAGNAPLYTARKENSRLREVQMQRPAGQERSWLPRKGNSYLGE